MGAWGCVGRRGEAQGGRGARGGRRLPLPSLPYTGPLARPHHTQPPCDSHPACRVGRKERGQHPGRDKSHPKNWATRRSRATAPQHRHTQPPAAARRGGTPAPARLRLSCYTHGLPGGGPGQRLDCWTLVSTSSGALLNQVRMQLRRRPRSEQDWCPRQEATPSGLSLPPALPSSWHTSLLWDPLVRGKGDTKPTSLSTGVAEARAPTAAGSPGHSRKHACSWGKESKRQRMCARNTPQGHTQAHSQAASPPRGPVSLLTAHTHPCEAHCGRGTSSPEGTEASPSLQAHPVRALSLRPPTGQSPCGHGRARAATRRD